MTNEEIQQKIVGAVEMFERRSDGTRVTLIGILSACAGSLVLQAYEEAAQIADKEETRSWGYEYPTAESACESIASDIRALKDSLVPVKSASP